MDEYFAKQFISNVDYTGFICHVKNDEFHFDFRRQREHTLYEFCRYRYFNKLELRFSRHQKLVLNKNFNFQGLIDFLLFVDLKFDLQLSNLGGFSIDLGIVHNPTQVEDIEDRSFKVKIVNSRIDFYTTNGKLVESCQDLGEVKNLTWTSIFQLSPNNDYPEYLFFNCQFK